MIIEGMKHPLTKKDIEYINETWNKTKRDNDLRFFTSCCDYCGTKKGCCASLFCMCHAEQVEHIKMRLKLGEYKHE